jgi:hypothetical protein
VNSWIVSPGEKHDQRNHTKGNWFPESFFVSLTSDEVTELNRSQNVIGSERHLFRWVAVLTPALRACSVQVRVE